MPYPVPNYWIVSGSLNKNGIPFYEGKVYADNLKNGVFQTIAETGISFDGSFTLGFSSSQFQNGDTTLEYPTLAARFAQRQLDAAKTKLQAELERRKKEWLVEDEVADAEVAEIEKEEVVNEIKVQQVEKEQKNIEREILRSEEIYDVLSEKFTNNDLYIWLEKELGKVFRQYVKTLLEVAQMAEKAYHFEIDGKIIDEPEFMAGDYWETFYKGLLAPERILLDLRRMEKAYLENDVHEMEITRPVSLRELQEKADDYEINDILYVNPLNKIRENGSCNFQLTEEFFEHEFSNLSFLRIKNVKIYI